MTDQSAGAISVQGTAGPAVRAVAMRLLIPFVGLWLADIELDPATVALAPTSGKVTVTVGQPVPTVTLVGTIDPRGSGAFVGVPRLRVVAGAGGWEKVVPAQFFGSDGPGIPFAQVLQATGTAAGEAVVVSAVLPNVQKFWRSAGPARRVLDGLTWWVDLAGVTQVGPRPTPTTNPTSLTLLRWHPDTEVAELTCDTVIAPGTVISDARIPGGSVTVRDVEQRFDGRGSSVEAWCGDVPVAQLVGDLRNLVEELSGRKLLATYLYRIALQGSDGRLQLQAVNPSAGAPDTIPVDPWVGVSGASTKYQLGTLVRVAFLEANPTTPIVDAYQPGAKPLENTLDASAAVHLGPSAALVDLAGGGHPLAFADLVQAELVKIAAALASVGGSYVPPTTPPGSLKVTSA